MPHVRSAMLKSEMSSRPVATRRRRSGGSLGQLASFNRFTPIARAIALTIAAGGAAGNVHAAQPFSAGWYASKGALQDTARTTGMVNGKSAASFSTPAAQQQQASAQLKQSIANLSLAAHGIAMMQAQQAAWRRASLGNPSSIPDGLGVGGLDTGSLASSWINASAPTQTTDASGKIVVDIVQTADKAIANWESFNVGKNTIVQFDQASSDWAILNRINDPLAPPSQIQGQIRAPGTVLIVNRNGIVFSGSSQISTRNLVAAAADISDSQFTTGGIYGANATASFTNASGDLKVEAGARITTNAPGSVTQGGGYVLLMGKQVSNSGDIETPNGQIEMAAGDNFIIRKGVGTDDNKTSTTRGNEISPQFVAGSTAGQVINTGLLLAREGDITLAGHDVQQNGVAVATTSVNTRGTIHLLNSASDATGLVTLGSSAITTVVLEDDATTALDSQRAALIADSLDEDQKRLGAVSAVFDNLSKNTDREDQSRIEIVSGGDVRFAGNSLTLATGGQIAVSAGNRTFAAAGSILDVSGAVGVNLAMASNNVVVNVQGNELRDSPDNRDSGSLFNSNITVDRRDLILVPASADYPTDRWYTAGGLLEVSGYVNNQGHTIGEWGAQGGTIQLGGKEVVTQTGSQINLSGGSLNVATGYVAQTWLVGSDGNLYNADDAPTGMSFTGVYKGFEVSHPRWGKDASVFFYNPLIAPQKRLENGYTVGRDAGQLIIDAPTAVLEGTIVATVYNGSQQIRGRDAVDGYSQAQTAVAQSGGLLFGQYGPGGLTGVDTTDIRIGDIADVTDGMAADTALTPDRANSLWLDAGRINAEGLGVLNLSSHDGIRIDAPLQLTPGGQITLLAPVIDIAANITAASGSLVASNLPDNFPSLFDASGKAGITVESGATVDLRGVWTNALLDPAHVTGLAYTDGGSASLDSSGSIILAQGGTIDVSSGAAILASGKTQGGTGGDVTLTAADPAGSGALANANLTLDGTMRSMGVNGGGKLVLSAPGTVVLGEADTGTGSSGTTAPTIVDPTLLRSGFASYDINGGNGIVVAAGEYVAPVMPVYRIIADGRSLPAGSDPSAALAAWLPPLYSENPASAILTQRGGASLTLRSLTKNQAGLLSGGGSITVPQDASITVDPGQDITLQAFGQITIDGSLTAHGGSISVTGTADGSGDAARNFDATGNARGISLWIGDGAVLDASGQSYQAFDAQGHVYGQAQNGGSIVLGAGTAFVIVRPGAELNADGAAAGVDMVGQRMTLAGNGGTIAFSSGGGLYLDGNFHAFGAGPGAAGGSLQVSLMSPLYVYLQGQFIPQFRMVPSVLTVGQTHQALLPADIAPGTDAASLTFGQASLGVDQIAAGGFGALSLTSTDYLVFDGSVRLAMAQSVALNATVLTSTAAVPDTSLPSMPKPAGNVSISAPYVLLQNNLQPVPDNATTGAIKLANPSAAPTAATFGIDASQIDVRGSVLFSAAVTQYDASAGGRVSVSAPGFSDIRLVSSGDIRFLGSASVNGTMLYTPWDMTLEGAQIYPATGVKATIAAGVGNTAYDATLTTARSTDVIPDAPQSVFGDITFAAPTVEQGGVVRAPFGKITFGGDGRAPSLTQQLDLLPGSLASVSMEGMSVPYGGTVDGVTYTYNGTAVVAPILTGLNVFKELHSGIDLIAGAIDVKSGATLDLSGGGTLAGAGFISGRGGSVNVLNTPLINANPFTPVSRAGNKVYAIVPGYASGYAPVAPEKGDGDPVIGQQITIGNGVPGLPAGTYTLLPSNYALLPGAYRVEVGQTLSSALAGTTALGNGSYAASGTLGIANTGVRNSTPSMLVVTPGSAVRNYSQYDEQSYSDFQRAQAAQFGGIRSLLPEDGQTLLFTFQQPVAGASALSFAGVARMNGARGGFGGQVVTSGVGEIYGAAPTPGFTGASVSAAALTAINAPRLSIDGFVTFGNDNQSFTLNGFGGDVNVRDGVTLQAGEIFLVGDNINIDRNVTLSTIGRGDAPFDSVSTGLSYNESGSVALALSNGALDFTGSVNTGHGAINIDAGSSLYSEGTVAFVTNGSVGLDAGAHFGSRNISLVAANLNIGNDADMAAGNAPAGLVFNQALFDLLVHGDALHGAPALEKLTLSAGDALNVFGSASMDARGSGVDLVLAAAAIYGYGGSSDQATIAADRIEWDSIAGQAPSAIVAGGPGTGSGSLILSANEIDLGQFAHLDTTSTSRVTYGFANVNLDAGSSITTAGNTALYVFQAASTTAGDVFGQSGTGGNLTLNTPLLTGMQKSIVNYTAGGVLTVAAPAGIAPGTANSTVAGAEIDLNGDSVNIGSTILLPSGKLAVKAVNDITLQDGSRIDLSGQPSMIQTATVYGFGGIVSFDSAQGNITQTAGSVIDVSATQANAGSITATAANGHVALSGALQGTADSGFSSGDFSATAAAIDDFDGLNARLTQGGVFDARSFDVKSGDLTVGDGVKAHAVTIAVDNGDLTVNGKIDASGAAPGTIRLSAQGDLILAASAILDAHGDTLQVDSYGQSIAAKNRGHIELNTAAGTLQLQPGATMDLSTPDGVAYGEVQLNAPRTGKISGDIAINAGGPLNIRGAYGIALNAMWTYDLPGGSVIDQSLLDGYDMQNLAFIDAAYNGNTDAGILTANLQNKLSGLLAQGSAFHLRPGVQIISSGDLSTSGDIDLSHYRYGPGADRDLTSVFYGAGEPMALTVRAGGNLDIKGSITDGFGPLPGKPATGPTSVFSAIIAAGTMISNRWLFGTGAGGGPKETIYILSEWIVPNDPWYSFPDANYLTSTTGQTYGSGSHVPPGTMFEGDGFNAFLPGYALPSYKTLTVTPGQPATQPSPPTSPVAALLAPGSQSASLRLVAGADTGAADPRAMQSMQALNGSGNLTFNDPRFTPAQSNTYLSVVRTGTGSLDLLAGGSFSEATPFGIYTAGTQSAPILAADGSNPYDLINQMSTSHAWYPEQGGDVLISAQGDVSGNIQFGANGNSRSVPSDIVSNWLWKQGGAGATVDPTAWWVNFGTLGRTNINNASDMSLVGFQGIGTLGGGNLTVIAGGDAGVTDAGSQASSSGLNLAVASTGRVLADGTLVQTGGGDLVVKVGGTFNPVSPTSAQARPSDHFGAITDLRGNITIAAGAIGQIAQSIGGQYWTSLDPRTPDIGTDKHSAQTPGPTVLPGDGSVRISARGDLVIAAGDAGMASTVLTNGMPFTQLSVNGPTLHASGGESYFTLWTPDTAIYLYSAGGDVSPRTGEKPDSGVSVENANGFYPGTLSVVAANGDIRFAEQVSLVGSVQPLELIPSPNGQLELLAAGSIYGNSRIVALSGADMSTLATPFQAAFQPIRDVVHSNAAPDAAYRLNQRSPIAFGEDTPVSDLHAGDGQPALVYAGIDIDDLTIGSVRSDISPDSSISFSPGHTTWYTAAKPFEVIAGRDIIGMGATPSVFVNDSAGDITLLQAGRDIIYQSVIVGGPGLLQVQAGRNLYQSYYGSLESVGQLYGVSSSTRDGGAGIAVITGVGASGPDYTDFARLYFVAANQADTTPGHPLADQPGKVAKTYDPELQAWLLQRFGYSGSAQDALAYFLALPAEQQGVFVRQVYYAELTAGGREFNDPDSTRFQSYLRGRQAIAALFPTQDAQGDAIAYNGSLTMFSSVTGTQSVNGQTLPLVSDAGIHTDFGGAIQILNPGGQTLIGVEGVTPTGKAGLITQGEGDIDIYSAGSILLGQSRIMTTFGGDILAWSAEGDINAGRGSKTTILFTPPRRVYDELGNVTISPNVPSTGAGIATLNPIPEVAAGDVDLIAPLGTIDAGEAGIRVSGNVNLAALQVVNAANIQVQGKSTGLPLIATVNVNALTNASAAATQAAMAAQDVVNRERTAARQALPSIFTVRVLGFGNDPAEGGQAAPQTDGDQHAAGQATQERQRNAAYDPGSAFQVLGQGKLDATQMARLTEAERRRLPK